MESDTVFSPWLIWFLLGLGFAFLELFMPGFIVIFFGIGCLLVAGILLVWKMSVSVQISLFIAGTIVSLVLLRKCLMKVFHGTAVDNADNGLDDFPAGTQVKVIEHISPNRKGRISYRGAPWDAVSDQDIEEGEAVEIIRKAGGSGLVFFVRKINPY
jgi:inner membrane protein